MSARNKWIIDNGQLTIKLLFVIFTIYIVHFTLALPVYAQTATSGAITTQYSNTQNATLASPVYTDILVNNLFHTFTCLAVGSSITNQQCLTYQLTQDAQGVVSAIPILSSVNMSGGLVGVGANLLAGIYLTPPLATGDYLASISQGLGIKEVHAQVGGSGASVLNPILKLWQVSRNISYIVMIVIFLVIGFMVMFRQRINPQTVITAQAALPGLVIGLILITFSYFLAAFITDTAFIGTGIVGYYFSAAQGASFNDLLKNSSNENVLTIMSRFIGATGPDNFAGGITTVLDNITGFARVVIGAVISLIAYQYGSQLGGPIGGTVGAGVCAPPALAATPVTAGASLGLIPVCAAIGQIAGSLAGGGTLAVLATVSPAWIISAALYVLLLAILLYTMFRLLFRLINNYLSIIFLTVTAPFHFLAASLPGRQGIATDWVRNMLCNVLAFPAVFAVFYFVAFLLGDRSVPAASSTVFNITSPLTLSGGEALPLLGGLDLSFIRFLLAFGALMVTPSIPDIICRTIGKPGAAGQMLEQEISKAQAGGQRYMGQAGQATGAIGRDFGRASELGPKRSIAYVRRVNAEGQEWIEPIETEKTPGLIGQYKRLRSK